MSAHAVPLIIWGSGLVANLVWTSLNIRMEAKFERKLEQRFEEFRRYIEGQFVSKPLCDERHPREVR